MVKYCGCPCGSRTGCQCRTGSGKDCECPCKDTEEDQGCECCKNNQCTKEKCNCGTGCQCKCCKDKDGTYSSVNAFLSQGLMIVLAFTGDGYLKTYSKYEHDRSKWPTKDYGFWKSLGYWIGGGVSEACKSVKSSFTTNVRCKVLGKSEALLIVYEDQEF